MSHPNNTPRLQTGEVHYPYCATIVKAELHTGIKRSHSIKVSSITSFMFHA
ncbi:hypothetical protein HanRHA438_Chr10g0462491 [Helianthus annuus]|nr:hypothetical protein HanRHA438_Chr10g0462491 [Helianthus annuus]